MGIQTIITPGLIEVMPVLPGDDRSPFDPDIRFDRWLIHGSNDDILNSREWVNRGSTIETLKMSQDQQIAAQWHRRLLSSLLVRWKSVSPGHKGRWNRDKSRAGFIQNNSGLPQGPTG
jgi:hypothetical protein